MPRLVSCFLSVKVDGENLRWVVSKISRRKKKPTRTNKLNNEQIYKNQGNKLYYLMKVKTTLWNDLVYI